MQYNFRQKLVIKGKNSLIKICLNKTFFKIMSIKYNIFMLDIIVWEKSLIIKSYILKIQIL